MAAYQEEYYMEDDLYSVKSSTTSKYGGSNNTDTKKMSKLLKNINSADKGHYMVKKSVSGGLVKYECFATDVANHKLIRNAATGELTPYRCGSKEQDLYFKVIDVSGLGSPTVIPKHLFYSSPEQYEKHQHTKVSTDLKERWFAKYMAMRTRIS
jgi:hypothetical protein